MGEIGGSDYQPPAPCQAIRVVPKINFHYSESTPDARFRGDRPAAMWHASATISSCSKNRSRSFSGSFPSTSVCNSSAIERAALYVFRPSADIRIRCARRSVSWAVRRMSSFFSIRSSNEAIVFGSLEIVSAMLRCEIPFGSASPSVLNTVNWSGVIFKCAIRRRNAWFKPYQARRSSNGNRRRFGASIGNATVLGSPSMSGNRLGKMIRIGIIRLQSFPHC